MRMGFQNPNFEPARLTISNERCEGLVMPLGLMENFGLCAEGWIDPCSIDDLVAHSRWLESYGIPDAGYSQPFDLQPIT